METESIMEEFPLLKPLLLDMDQTDYTYKSSTERVSVAASLI